MWRRAQDLVLSAGEGLVAHRGQPGEVFGVLGRPAVGLHARAQLVDALGRLPHPELRAVAEVTAVDDS